MQFIEISTKGNIFKLRELFFQKFPVGYLQTDLHQILDQKKFAGIIKFKTAVDNIDAKLFLTIKSEIEAIFEKLFSKKMRLSEIVELNDTISSIHGVMAKLIILLLLDWEFKDLSDISNELINANAFDYEVFVRNLNTRQLHLLDCRFVSVFFRYR